VKHVAIRKIILMLLISFIPASEFKNSILRKVYSWKIGKNVHVGIALIFVDSVIIEDDAYIGNFNVMKGFSKLKIGYKGFIGKNNRFITNPQYSWNSSFVLGANSVITANHLFDLTDSIEVGENVVIGGGRSEFWTHGFDVERKRLQGAIQIGDNVYIGSSCKLNLGVCVGNKSVIGLGAVVTKSFTEGNVFIGGNPAKIIHTNVIITENERNVLYKEVNNNLFYRRKN
jgi:acetyltransferase-like isoleucine patch superfamily enzyme